jgi:drug/metabolite transporter (DMT)-like permease
LASEAGRKALGYGLVVFAAACWATGGVTAKWLFTRLSIDVDPLTLSSARALVAFLVLIVPLALFRRDLLRVERRYVGFLAIFGFAGMAMLHLSYYEAIANANVATAILLEYLAPVLVLIVSVSFLGERFTWVLPAGVALSVLGAGLVVGAIGGGGMRVTTLGILWGLAAAVFFAAYIVMGKYAAGRIGPWALLTWGLGFAALFWAAAAPLLDASPIPLLADAQGLVAALYIAVVTTVVPFGAFLAALHYIDATKASVTSTVEPVIAAVLSFFVLGETLDGLQLLGGALVIAAVVLVQRPVSGRAPEGEAVPPSP